MKPIDQAIAEVYTTQKKKSMTKAVKTIKPELTQHSAEVKASRLLNNDEVVTYIKSKSLKAAKRINKLAFSAKNEGVRLAANQDLLNRSGVTKEAEPPANPQVNEALLKAIEGGDEIQLLRILRAK